GETGGGERKAAGGGGEGASAKGETAGDRQGFHRLQWPRARAGWAACRWGEAVLDIAVLSQAAIAVARLRDNGTRRPLPVHRAEVTIRRSVYRRCGCGARPRRRLGGGP